MTSITPITPDPTLQTVPETPGAGLGKQEFLQLLITQLRNQDPLNPMDDRQFIAQMAQLSTLEATQGVAGQMGAVLAAHQQTQALQLVGREVQYADEQGVLARGRVGGARLDAQPPLLVISGREVPLSRIQTVL